MVMHPVQVVQARVEDALGVPHRHVLLRRDLHEARFDLVLVLEPHDHFVVDPLRLGGTLIAQAPNRHS
jgi:nicotinamide riboside kinase